MEYINHFPADKRKGRFFVKLSESTGLPTQNIGKNMLGKYPKLIAEALHLPDPDDFSGHSFRRSGATLLADAGSSPH